MERSEFLKLRREFNRQCEKVLLSKNKDYAENKDSLANFKSLAKLVGITPLQVWGCYFGKQILAIFSLVRSGKLHSESPRGRFLDARNFSDLGLALWEDLDYARHVESQVEAYKACDKIKRRKVL